MGISLSLFDESAEKTLKAIDDAIKQDNGKAFKEWEKAYFNAPDIDAWRADKKGELRDHLGASQIGDECERKAWLKFRTAETECDPRLIRLWNRGHLEEMRFMALLQQAGIQAWNYDADRGRQFGYAKDRIGTPAARKTDSCGSTSAAQYFSAPSSAIAMSALR